MLDLASVDAVLFASGSLDAFLAAGPDVWRQVRDAARDALVAEATPLTPLADVRPVLAFTVADYVDFYASEHHASNAGRIFRPDAEPLPPNWKAMPVGYHGRSGSVVVSGTPIRRPAGHLDAASFGPSQRLDFEAELGFVVGAASEPGCPVAVDDADRHVFGVVLLDDWSARDIQRFETVPLGPFLGKSFATSVSAWITPLAALEHAAVPSVQEPVPVRELLSVSEAAYGLDLDLEVRVNDTVVSRPRAGDLYWTYAQMLAHLTSNGAHVRPGDLFASGTVSGPERGQRGCLLELTWNGADPITLHDGTNRSWLHDGDEVTVSARAGSVTLGEVCGRVVTG